MKLLKQDNKIILYDDIHDKYIPIEPDDLSHILDDNNKLLDNETVLNYFRFKHNEFKENKKGYTSKKIDLGKQQDETLKNINKDYLAQSFLSKIDGLSEIDRIAFIKNPSVNTIKRFSTDKETINKLIKIFENIKKTTIEIRNNGDDIDDMINYLTKNDKDVSITKAIKTNLETQINSYRDGKITKMDLLELLKFYRDKFKNNNEYEKFVKIIAGLEQKPEGDKDKETKDKDEKIEEILNNNFKDEQKRILAKEDFNNDGYEEAQKLNNLNKLTPENIFQTSHIKRINKNEISNNSKIYRVLKYLSTNNLLNQDNIDMEDKKDIRNYKITIPKKGVITFSLYEDDYLSPEIDNYLKDIENNNINDIFKNQTYENIYNHESNNHNDSLKFTYTPINPFSKEYDDEKEQLKDVIDELSDDITKQQFDDIVNKYYEKFDINERDPIEPFLIKINEKYYKTDDEYKDKFGDYPPNSLLTKYRYDFFNVLPFSFWRSNLPKELIEEYKTPYNFKWTVLNTFDDIIKKQDKKEKEKDEKIPLKLIHREDYDIDKLFEEKTEAIKTIEENNEEINKLNTDLIHTRSKKTEKEINNQIQNLKQQNKDLEQKIKEKEEKINKLREKLPKIYDPLIPDIEEKEELKEKLNSNEVNENLIDGLFEKFKNDLKNVKENDERLEQLEKTKEKFKELFKKYFEGETLKYFTTSYYKNPDSKVAKKTSNEEMRRNKIFDDKRRERIEKEFEGFGGKNWSYSTLSRIDKINENLNNIKANGRLNLGGKNWSYFALSRIDKINEKIKQFN